MTCGFRFKNALLLRPPFCIDREDLFYKYPSNFNHKNCFGFELGPGKASRMELANVLCKEYPAVASKGKIFENTSFEKKKSKKNFFRTIFSLKKKAPPTK